MSESFLLVVPPGWVQLDWQFITNNLPDMSMSNVLDYINSGSLGVLEAHLKEAGLISASATLVEAKLFDDTYFIVRLG